MKTILLMIVALPCFYAGAAGFVNGGLDQWEDTSQPPLNVRYAAWVENQTIVCKVDFMQHPELVPHFGVVAGGEQSTENLISPDTTAATQSLIHTTNVPACKGEQLSQVARVTENSYIKDENYIHKASWIPAGVGCVAGFLVVAYYNIRNGLEKSTQILNAALFAIPAYGAGLGTAAISQRYDLAVSELDRLQAGHTVLSSEEITQKMDEAKKIIKNGNFNKTVFQSMTGAMGCASVTHFGTGIIMELAD